MNPREIHVHIEELVLHGLEPRSRWSVGDAFEAELRRLVVAQGIPSGWHPDSRPRLVEGSKAAIAEASGLTGEAIARATYGGNAP